MGQTKKIGLGLSLVPLICVLLGIFFYVLDFESSWIGWGLSDAQVPLIFGTIVAIIVALSKGYEWVELEKMMIDGIKLVLGAILILFIVGMIIGTWLMSGVVGTMIYYGIGILHPSILLVVSVIICSIVSISIGSSWTTTATIGIALIGIGSAYGVDPPIMAGAIISGAYFGDKLSPLSDTTNLASAISGTTMFSHIKHMLYTTIPAYIITLIIFLIMGFFVIDHSVDNVANIEDFKNSIKAATDVKIWLLLIPIATITFAAMKYPVLPVLFIGAFLGIIAALVNGIDLPSALQSLHYGWEVTPSVFISEDVANLLSGGGIDSMMWTISLIMVALCFGGIMEGTGMLQTIVSAILTKVKTGSGIIASTVITALGLNVFAGDQFMAIAITGRMYKGKYIEYDLHPKNLSRALEDAGTVSSALIPWNTCGAYMATTLGVSTIAYLPFAFFNWIAVCIGILTGFVGYGVTKLSLKDKNILLENDEACID